MRKMTMWLLPFICALVLVCFGATVAFAAKPSPVSSKEKIRLDKGKPPWAQPFGPKDQPPVHAPEPITITLIGMGASAAAGYYFGKKKNSAK